MSEHSAEKDAESFALTDAERMKISAVVHQNYFMPDVFDVVEQIIHLRSFYVWEAGFAAGITAERGGRVQNPWARDRLVLRWQRHSARSRRAMSTTLCFVDTETTGLDPRIHQPYEVCYWREDEESPTTLHPGHTLEYADRQALDIGGYFARHFAPEPETSGWTARHLSRHLAGVTLVGSNPAFDAAMLTRIIGTPVWHHRLINVAEGAMWVFGWDRPKGLADVAAECRKRGYEIPEPDHTAEGDVRATRAVYEALRAEAAR